MRVYAIVGTPSPRGSFVWEHPARGSRGLRSGAGGSQPFAVPSGAVGAPQTGRQ